MSTVVRVAIESRGDQLCVTNCMLSTVQLEHRTLRSIGLFSRISYPIHTNIDTLKYHNQQDVLNYVTRYLITLYPLNKLLSCNDIGQDQANVWNGL
jgi:hypothetical protein